MSGCWQACSSDVVGDRDGFNAGGRLRYDGLVVVVVRMDDIAG